MARSNNVLAVVGMLCVNARFRDDFFRGPQQHAQALVGTVPLTDNEIAQILRLACAHVPEPTRSVQWQTMQAGFNGVFTAMNCNSTCPLPPCPCPDNEDAELAVVL